MKIRKTITASAVVAGAIAVAVPALANTTVAEQDFTGSTGDWVEFSGSVISNPDDELRIADADPNEDFGTGLGWDAPNYGAYSYYDGVTADTGTERTTPLGDGYISELDVYLDPAALAVGEGFDLTVAASRLSGPHLRDFIFHVGMTNRGLIVNGSNNTDFRFNDYKLFNNNSGAYYPVINAGWYSLQHVFRSSDDGLSLAVDLNLVDAGGSVLWSASLNNPGDAVADVGGALYIWVTYVEGSFDFDNQSLERIASTPETKDDCKKSGYAKFGFENQGQCVASVVANVNANH